MKKKLTVLSVSLLCILMLAAIPMGTVKAIPPDPFSVPNQIGDFGNLRVGDQMWYGLEFSENLKDFYWDQSTQDLIFQLMFFLAIGDFDQARTWQNNVNNFLSGIEDARIKAQVTNIIHPNETYVGRVQGLVSVEQLDFEAIYQLLTGFQLINSTAEPFDDWVAAVLPQITDLNANLTMLTLIENGLNGFTAPFILNNNWTYWAENIDYFNATLAPLAYMNQYYTTHMKTGLDAWYFDVIVNASWLVDTIIGPSIYPLFNNQSEYDWWVSLFGNVTLNNWLHRQSGVGLELQLAMNMSGFMDAVEHVVFLMWNQTHDTILEFALNILGSLSRPGVVTTSFVLKDYKYGGTWILGGPGYLDMTWLWITLAIVIPVSCVVAAVMFYQRTGTWEPKAGKIKIPF